MPQTVRRSRRWPTRSESTWSPPSLVVNSAGAGVWRFLEETTPDGIVEMIGAPYLAAANVCRAFMADMLAAGRGGLIHVGSPASLMPWPGATAYTASRWALRGLHEALCMDLVGTGVTSSLIYFGEVSSEYFEANPDSHEYIPAIGGWIPVTTPERCAEVVLGRRRTATARGLPPLRIEADVVVGQARARPHALAHRPYRATALTARSPTRTTRIQVSGFRIQDSGFRSQDPGFIAQDP